MVVTLEGIVTEVKPVILKAWLPMVVKPSVNVNDDRLAHSWKARSPKLVTLEGMVTEVKPVL